MFLYAELLQRDVLMRTVCFACEPAGRNKKKKKRVGSHGYLGQQTGGCGCMKTCFAIYFVTFYFLFCYFLDAVTIKQNL